MSTLRALTAGVPPTGLELLSSALQNIFPGIDIQTPGKDDLRFNVRLSSRSSDAFVLVVLDKYSMDECKDIAGGLYESDRFYMYTTDSELVQFLNKKYELSLDVPDDQSMEVNQEVYSAAVSKDKINEYLAQIADRDGEITTLKFQIQELETLLQNGGYTEDDGEIDRLSSENLSLKSKLADLEGTNSSLTESISSMEEQLKVANIKESQLSTKLASLQADYEGLNREWTDEKVSSSKKSAVIKDKDDEIIRLQSKLSKLEDAQKEVAGYTAEKAAYQSTIDDLTKSLSELRIEMANKDAEIERLNEQIRSNASDTKLVMEYKGYLRESEEEKVRLGKKVKELENSLEKLNSNLNESNDTISSLEEELDKIDEEMQQKDTDLATLNTIKIELEGKIRVLEQSTDRNADIEDSLKELTELRHRIADLQSNIFSRISDTAYPRGSVKVNLLPLVGIHYKNIRFVFAGSTESRKGVYKSLLKEFSEVPKTKFLIVDAVSETYVDYVFQISKIIPGTDWFTSGGGVQPYLSQTLLQNVKVLSNGLNFVNDSFLLTVNWAKRLEELENSGYAVIIMCGDISSLVGRIMFESFSDMAATTVYTLGNSVGSRTVLSNMRGMSTAKNATVVYFDFNKRMSAFYDKMSKICQCHILNYISKD